MVLVTSSVFPAKVRNQIYTYALTDLIGLRVCKDTDNIDRLLSAAENDTSDPNPLKVSSEDDANQLKFVNRQLNSDTGGGGLHYNELYFHHVIGAVCFLRVLPDIMGSPQGYRSSGNCSIQM